MSDDARTDAVERVRADLDRGFLPSVSAMRSTVAQVDRLRAELDRHRVAGDELEVKIRTLIMRRFGAYYTGEDVAAVMRAAEAWRSVRGDAPAAPTAVDKPEHVAAGRLRMAADWCRERGWWSIAREVDDLASDVEGREGEGQTEEPYAPGLVRDYGPIVAALVGQRDQVVAAPAAAPTDGQAPAEEPLPTHTYLSTGCLHGDHGYCQSMTGQHGAKRPGRCKFCDAACVCPCHDQTFATAPADDTAAPGPVSHAAHVLRVLAGELRDGRPVWIEDGSDRPWRTEVAGWLEYHARQQTIAAVDTAAPDTVASKARGLGRVQAILDRLRPHLPGDLFGELSAAVYISDRPITAEDEQRAIEGLHASGQPVRDSQPEATAAPDDLPEPDWEHDGVLTWDCPVPVDLDDTGTTSPARIEMADVSLTVEEATRVRDALAAAVAAAARPVRDGGEPT